LAFAEVSVVSKELPAQVEAGSGTVSGRSPLDSLDSAIYSFPFRTYSLKLTSNVRLVLSVWRRCPAGNLMQSV
jgi:hypothetical protein